MKISIKKLFLAFLLIPSYSWTTTLEQVPLKELAAKFHLLKNSPAIFKYQIDGREETLKKEITAELIKLEKSTHLPKLLLHSALGGISLAALGYGIYSCIQGGLHTTELIWCFNECKKDPSSGFVFQLMLLEYMHHIKIDFLRTILYSAVGGYFSKKCYSTIKNFYLPQSYKRYRAEQIKLYTALRVEIDKKLESDIQSASSSQTMD